MKWVLFSQLIAEGGRMSVHRLLNGMAPTNNTNYQWIESEKLSEGTQTYILWSFSFFFETKWQKWAKLQSFSLSLYEPKVWNTLGDTLLQHVTMTNHWLCTGQATSCVTRYKQQTSMCTEEFLWKSWSRERSFVIERIASDLNLRDLLQGLNSPVHTKKFVIAMCCHYVFVQLVT